MARPASSDPFLEQFFARLPAEMHTDFSDRQLAALKSVFGDATRSGHLYDIRMSLPAPFARHGFYLVTLGGRDRRDGRRRHGARTRRGLARLGAILVGALFVLQLVLMAVGLAVWLL